MLTLAAVTKADVVYDLGCGDGRIPIAAAKTVRRPRRRPGHRSARIEESRANAKAAGVEHLVEFRVEDVMTADVSKATVVTLYLLSSSNAKLRPILTSSSARRADRLARVFDGTDLAGRQGRSVHDGERAMRSRSICGGRTGHVAALARSRLATATSD